MKKLITFGLSAATALSMTGGVLMPVAGAVTIEELQAQIATLTAQIAAMGGESTSTTACYSFTVDLTEGSTGPDVTTLQNYLQGTGHFTFAGGATGYFGPVTKAAVAAWQAAYGVAPAYGYFGPISRAKYASLCVPAADEDEDEEEAESTDLEGGAGSINDADWVSSLSNEEVGEDEADVEVAGLEIEADDGSDIELTAVRLDFTQGTAGNDFEDYADEVSVWLDGTEYARFDGDAFTDDNNYDKTVSLEDGAVIKAGETGELVVAVSGVSNLDTADVGDTWTVEFENVRFVDADGASTIDNATGDINGVTRTFSFESFATAGDIELKIAEADNDAVNKAHMINIHLTDDTDDVILLDFTLEAEGDSDLEIKEFGVDLVVTGAAHVDDVIKGGTSPAVKLVIDGEEYGDASYNEDGDGVDVGQDEEVLFDDVNYTLEAGETVDAQIVVDLLADDTDLDEGDTILAQILETQTDDAALVDVRDESNTQLVDADITGQATGEANQMYDVIFVISDAVWEKTGQTSSDTAGIDETVTFELTFDLEAVDGTIYVDDGCAEDSDGVPSEDGLNYSSSNDADFTFACLLSSAATQNATNFEVEEDETETFSATVTVTASVASDTAQLTWEALEWSEADEVGDRLYTGNLDETKSVGVFINNR